MVRYAQIKIETGIVICVSELNKEVYADNMILIDEGFDVTNKKYINGEWVEYTPEEPPEEPPTQLDRIEATVNNIANAGTETTQVVNALLGV